MANVQLSKVSKHYGTTRVLHDINLEIADGRSFFVGQAGMLVHDNSLVEPTPAPFDAPPALAAKVSSTTN